MSQGRQVWGLAHGGEACARNPGSSAAGKGKGLGRLVHDARAL